MLTWRRCLTAGLLAAALGTVHLSTPAAADGSGGVNCGPFAGNCQVNAGGGSTPTPGSGGSGSTGGSSGGGGGASCSFSGHTYACYSATYGWFDQVDGCYYQLMDPQPAANSSSWQGHQPGDGAVYASMCPLITGKGLPGGSAKWFQNPPPGYGGAVDVAALAQQAVKNMGLVGPQIGIAPKVGGKGSLVGLPVWLWDTVTPTTWGPNTATASAGGVTVTATGSATQIVWSMGDGTTVTCGGPGTAYLPSFGTRAPDCGHVYTTTSANQPGGAYTINATATWVVGWTATTGQQGTITVTRQSASTAVIGELQVLNNQ